MGWNIIKKADEIWGYQFLSAKAKENYRKDGYECVYAHDEETCKRIMKGGDSHEC